ncbi:MAG: hypothetical protein ABIO40_05035 [Devosia sp.]
MLTPDQQELHDFMSEISELCYCAGWMIGTEGRLWAFMSDADDDGKWGQRPIPQSARATLHRLSQRAGGWIVWMDGDLQAGTGGPAFVPLVEWQDHYNSAIKAGSESQKWPRRFSEFIGADR